MLFIIRESDSVYPAFCFSFIECHKGESESTQRVHDKIIEGQHYQKPSVKLHAQKYD